MMTARIRTKRALSCITMLSLVCVVTCVMLGCSNNGVSASSSASNANSKEIEAAMSKVAGTWELIEAPTRDDDNKWTSVSSDVLDSWRDQGYEMYLLLNEDGSATYVDRNRNEYGTWRMTSEGEGEVVLDRLPYTFQIKDSKLVLSDQLSTAASLDIPPHVFAKSAEEKNPLSEKEYEEARSAFTGKWSVVSMSDGEATITKESGQLQADLPLELKDDMTYVADNDGSLTGRWMITGTDSGCLDAPAAGDSMKLSDGLMTLKAGDSFIVTYAKE